MIDAYMSNAGGVLSVTPFHNANCPHGMVYAVSKGSLHFGQLPPCVSYTGVWPARRVLMRCTVHALVYQPETKCYILAASHPTPVRTRKVPACPTQRVSKKRA